MIERHILTENLKEKKGDPKIAKQIRENSRGPALTKEEVERDITHRSFGEIDGSGDFATAEQIEKRGGTNCI